MTDWFERLVHRLRFFREKNPSGVFYLFSHDGPPPLINSLRVVLCDYVLDS